MGRIMLIWIILIPVVVGLTYLLFPTFLIPQGQVSFVHAVFLSLYLVGGVKYGLFFLAMEIDLWFEYDLKLYKKLGCQN